MGPLSKYEIFPPETDNRGILVTSAALQPREVVQVIAINLGCGRWGAKS